ncbi:hypothetical protein JAAARDRAFT_78615 [Jaapia argillacea MUCL 33604]|uniref:Aminoglycoside phosphotransferase domain-containing protein n=1 Tax=Jaapia argillacea MUCL 33604 TaxID=933084 RepID=A0A067PRI3_9AGAM|nr:hypothetical protein JAAARDRAFT_78615 [Jaapia argillacea MUCL 33604]
MSNIKFDIVVDNKPNSLPSAEEIIQQCRTHALANAANSTSYKRGVSLVDESKDGAPYAWVKYGRSITMAEARTQHYVAQVVNGDDDAAVVRVPYVYLSFESHGRGYIVMEFIDGVICSDADAKLVAAAVQFLATIRGPTTQPGPIGGGPICHDFFIERESSLTYSSVGLLEKHINGILKHEGRPHRVSLGPEVEEYGLRLCLSDMNRDNFIKDRKNKIVALDFGASCFLPVSFFDFALRHFDYFTQLLRMRIPRPKSKQLEALLVASFSLVPYGTNKIAHRCPTRAQGSGPVDFAHKPSRLSTGPRLLRVIVRRCELSRCLLSRSSLPTPSHTVRARRFSDIYMP